MEPVSRSATEFSSSEEPEIELKSFTKYFSHQFKILKATNQCGYECCQLYLVFNLVGIAAGVFYAMAAWMWESNSDAARVCAVVVVAYGVLLSCISIVAVNCWVQKNVNQCYATAIDAEEALESVGSLK